MDGATEAVRQIVVTAVDGMAGATVTSSPESNFGRRDGIKEGVRACLIEVSERGRGNLGVSDESGKYGGQVLERLRGTFALSAGAAFVQVHFVTLSARARAARAAF